MLTREALLEGIVLAKIHKQVSWAALAQAVGRSEVWTTSALLGQQSMDRSEAAKAVALLGLEPADEAIALLTTCPSKGSLGAAVPTDPLLYRLYEMIQVYGTTIKELVHEKMGDGIMSAIDFTMDIERVADPKGDRVKLTLNGKFLPYKKW